MGQGKALDVKKVRQMHKRYMRDEDAEKLARELECTKRGLIKAWQRLGLERRRRGRPTGYRP